MNVADELLKLQQLHDSGSISDEEFAQAKTKLLTTPAGGMDALFGATNTEQQTRQWAMLLHLSQFAGYLVPLGGFIAPILIWQLQKDKLPAIDEHGKFVCNWILSSVIYWIVSGLLAPLIIGIPMLAVMAVLVIVFPIIGAVKANTGEAWKYPLSIAFFK